MFEYLESIDRSIVLTVNGWNTPFLDQFFWIVTKTITWIPFYLAIFYLIWKNYGLKTTFIFLGMTLLMVAIVDSSTTFFFKDTVMRYRPSHNLLMEKQLHYFVKNNGDLYVGGKYGFFSSHASNNAALALLSWFFLRRFYPRLKWILIACVALIGLSRIYLTVHYLSDVLCGVIWGILWAFVFWKLYQRFFTRKLESE
ncbi:MAG: phosphoesterase PA-phosphatase related protein [Fluviicola sp.]|jgi:undecaprenyl-diphosphatase|uniref:phosphatase PAP2 family protein n=1 Tax=Fluviicola sp. TaxID=1917219 RepID=UPI002636E68A|nr:phosphatase PAP2 family protein [Fluviicola sp.]MDF3027804.1 phosphoesterase PA-phosphatase related protein [Fluviicola sp.]